MRWPGRKTTFQPPPPKYGPWLGWEITSYQSEDGRWSARAEAPYPSLHRTVMFRGAPTRQDAIREVTAMVLKMDRLAATKETHYV